MFVRVEVSTNKVRIARWRQQHINTRIWLHDRLKEVPCLVFSTIV